VDTHGDCLLRSPAGTLFPHVAEGADHPVQAVAAAALPRSLDPCPPPTSR
jgi:hypothetical protein